MLAAFVITNIARVIQTKNIDALSNVDLEIYDLFIIIIFTFLIGSMNIGADWYGWGERSKRE